MLVNVGLRRAVQSAIKAMKLALDYPLTTSLVPTKGTGSATFTRATTASLEEPVDGLIKTVKAGEIRFKARRVENGAISTASYVSAFPALGTGATVTDNYSTMNGLACARLQHTNTGTGFPFNANSTFAFTNSSTAYRTFSIKARIKSTNGTNQKFRFGLTSSGVLNHWSPDLTATATEQVFSYNVAFGNEVSTILQYQITGPVVNATFDILINELIVEETTGQANQNPSEYVSKGVLSAPYHGANVDGVKYFDTYNGNTVSSNVVIEATGAKIPEASLQGAMIEPASTNLCTQSNNFAVTWTQFNGIVATQNLIGIDGGTTGWTLTDSNAGAHAGIQNSIGLTATTYTFSCYVKKTTGVQASYPVLYAYGTTNIALATIDTSNGVGTLWTTYGAFTIVGLAVRVNSFNSNYWRVELVLTGSAVTWTCGISAAGALTPNKTGSAFDTAGVGSVGVTWFQMEPGSKATTYIPTTTASVTRNADVLTYPNAGNVSDTQGTVLMEATPYFDIPNSATAGYGQNFLMDFGTSSGQITLYQGGLARGDGTTPALTPSWTPLKNTTYKIGSRYGSAGQRNWLNGTAGTNVAFDGSINSTTNMTIGGWGGGTTYNWGGYIKNLKILKRVLSDETVNASTTIYMTDENGDYMVDENNNTMNWNQ